MSVSITLWEAYLLESLRSKGMDNETILTYIEEQNIDALNEFDSSFDHTDLVTTDNFKAIKQAIFSNYNVKFITINGLKNLLKMKFDLLAGEDFEMGENRFYRVPLTSEQLKTVETLTSPVWKVVNITSRNEGVVVDIVHASDVFVQS